MSGLRKLWREVARNQSYSRTGTTDLMNQIFHQKWRIQMGHKENPSPWRATKKGAKHC